MEEEGEGGGGGGGGRPRRTRKSFLNCGGVEGREEGKKEDISVSLSPLSLPPSFLPSLPPSLPAVLSIFSQPPCALLLLSSLPPSLLYLCDGHIHHKDAFPLPLPPKRSHVLRGREGGRGGEALGRLAWPACRQRTELRIRR